jgi:hypothetical protein
MTFNFESEDTGYTERMTIPLGVDFFYPSNWLQNSTTRRNF